VASPKSAKRIGANHDYSVSRKLRKEKKSSEAFETMLGRLPLEDIIALKLELAARSSSGKLHGLFLWKKLPNLIKDAIIKAALSITTTKSDACKLLGISERSFKTINKKYDTNNYFIY